MQGDLPKSLPGAIFYEDDKLYATLANNPITKGHVVVVWKERITDLHLLNKEQYEYLMDIVDSVRNAMLQTLNIEKIYLLYMDEAKHVHWHLVPRYDKKGIPALEEHQENLEDTSLAKEYKKRLKL